MYSFLAPNITDDSFEIQYILVQNAFQVYNIVYSYFRSILNGQLHPLHSSPPVIGQH